MSVAAVVTSYPRWWWRPAASGSSTSRPGASLVLSKDSFGEDFSLMSDIAAEGKGEGTEAKGRRYHPLYSWVKRLGPVGVI